MRVGKNPYKGEANKRPKSYLSKDVLCSMLVYIPNFDGYFKERFEVMKIALSSLIKHTDRELADIVVFDQGSCQEVVDYLLDLKNSHQITYLFLSTENLGYNGAKNFVYSICQGEYLCWADDDVFFYPNWLERSLAIAKTYPDADMVSASPISEKYLNNNTVARELPTRYNIELKQGKWNKDWDNIFQNSIGGAPKETTEDSIPLYVYNGVEAFPVNSHFQYLISKKARQVVYPFKVGLAMSSSFEDPEFNMILALDKKLDAAGCGKLCTNGLYAEHMGGSLSDRTLQLATEYKIFDIAPKQRSNKVTTGKLMMFKFMNIPVLGKLPIALYNATFNLISEKKQYDSSKAIKK